MSIKADIASKPVTHFAPSDWHTNNHLLATNAERLRDGSHANREDSKHLRNETYNKTDWGIHDNTTRLSNRIDDIEKWREILEKTLADTDEEINKLEIDKDLAERALEAKALPLDVASECLTLRDGRRQIDVVDDEASAQLQKVSKFFFFFFTNKINLNDHSLETYWKMLVNQLSALRSL